MNPNHTAKRIIWQNGTCIHFLFFLLQKGKGGKTVTSPWNGLRLSSRALASAARSHSFVPPLPPFSFVSIFPLLFSLFYFKNNFAENHFLFLFNYFIFIYIKRVPPNSFFRPLTLSSLSSPFTLVVL